MKFFKRSILLGSLVLALVAAFGLSLTPSFAQVAPQGTTYVIGPSVDLGSVKTLSAQVAATVNSADQNGAGVKRVFCTFNQSAKVGTPSSTIAIQNKDKVSGKYISLITSAAITADNTPTAVYSGDGLPVTTNVSAGLPIAPTWRLQIVVTGTTSTTATVGCVIVR